jgi:ABC-2 type transport system permease protein
MKAILRREFKSYFSSPIGYVCVAVLMGLFGYYFYQVMNSGSSSYVTSVYSTMFLWCMMIIPILTMKSLSEDKRNKTDQALLTAPVSVTSIVLGKFLAAFCIYAIAIAGSLLPVLIISFFTKGFGWAIVFGNVLGSLFYGGAMIAIGVFISSLTESQIIAAIGTFAISIFLMVIDQISSLANTAFITTLVGWISFSTRYQSFTRGMFDISSVVFFISVAAIFIFLAARKLESKRWS